MKRTMTCVTSLAALVVAAPLAFAQQKSDDRSPSQMPSEKSQNNAGGSERGQERGAERSQKAGERAGGASEKSQSESSASKQREEKSDKAESQAQEQSKEQRKDAKDESKDQRKDAKEERTKANDDKAKSGNRDERAGREGDAKDRKQEKSEGKNDEQKSRDRAGDTDRDRSRDQARERSGEQAGDRKSDQARGEVREEDRQKAEQVRSKVDRRERDRVRDMAFRGDIHRASNVNVRIDVGVRLPREVEVYDLPSDIVEIVPAYRGYRYVVVGDDYCIVDPETYLIVDVIHRGGRDGGQYAYRTGGRLELTNDQIEIIRRQVHDRGRKFDYKGDLEVGIKLPGDYDFEPFPDTVVREVPVMRDYRFVHVEDEIAIVAPDQPEVVYVIED